MFVPALVEALSAFVAAVAPRLVAKRADKCHITSMVEVMIDEASVRIARGVDATTIVAMLSTLKILR